MKQNETLEKEKPASKTNKHKILQLKMKCTALKKFMESFKSRLNHAEGKIDDLENRVSEITQSE